MPVARVRARGGPTLVVGAGSSGMDEIAIRPLAICGFGCPFDTQSADPSSMMGAHPRTHGCQWMTWRAHSCSLMDMLMLLLLGLVRGGLTLGLPVPPMTPVSPPLLDCRHVLPLPVADG